MSTKQLSLLFPHERHHPRHLFQLRAFRLPAVEKRLLMSGASSVTRSNRLTKLRVTLSAGQLSR